MEVLVFSNDKLLVQSIQSINQDGEKLEDVKFIYSFFELGRELDPSLETLLFLDLDIGQKNIIRICKQYLKEGQIYSILMADKLRPKDFKSIRKQNDLISGYIKKPIDHEIFLGVIEDYKSIYSGVHTSSSVTENKLKKSGMTDEISFDDGPVKTSDAIITKKAVDENKKIEQEDRKLEIVPQLKKVEKVETKSFSEVENIQNNLKKDDLSGSKKEKTSERRLKDLKKSPKIEKTAPKKAEHTQANSKKQDFINKDSTYNYELSLTSIEVDRTALRKAIEEEKEKSAEKTIKDIIESTDTERKKIIKKVKRSSGMELEEKISKKKL